MKRKGFTTYSEEDKLQIVMGLIGLRKQGRLQGVWWNHANPSVRFIGMVELERLSWREAAQMTGFSPATKKEPEMETRFRKTLIPRKRAV